MTDIFEVIAQRRSVRAYEERAVEREKLQRILECARAAPSAGNLQAYDVVVVQDAALRSSIARAALDQGHLALAAAVLVFFQNAPRSAAKYGKRGRELYALQDATIACAYAQLAAAALGLGSCWTGAFRGEPIRQLLHAPEGVDPVALLSVGYPAEHPAPTGRLPISEMVHFDTW